MFFDQDGDTTLARAVRNSSLVGLNASPALGVTALAGAFTSYKCLDAATYLAVFEGRSYPSGDAVALCALYRVTATTWAVAAAPLSGGRCPDVADLPPAGGFEFPGAPPPRAPAHAAESRLGPAPPPNRAPAPRRAPRAPPP